MTDEDKDTLYVRGALNPRERIHFPADYESTLPPGWTRESETLWKGPNHVVEAIDNEEGQRVVARERGTINNKKLGSKYVPILTDEEAVPEKRGNRHFEEVAMTMIWEIEMELHEE